MIEGMENQCLGTNAKAQEILKAQIDEFFPALNAAAEVSDEIVNKYYDWIFPYIWTDDGGQERRWASAVRSLCRKHAKLAELETFFEDNATDATQNEEYSGADTLSRTGDDTSKDSGTDNVTFTDNRKQTTTVTFRGVGAPTSSANTAETTETELAANGNDTDTQTTHGKQTTTTHNTTDTTTYGKKRTWTDGRTWTQVLADVWAATSPVYDFVNAFAQILLSPDTVCVIWEPTMSMTADAEKLAPGSNPTATIVNVGTATHPRWELHLGLVTGDTGATPEITVTASVDDNVGTPEVTVTTTGTPEHPDFDFAFKNMKGETGATGATPDITMTATVDDTTGTPAVEVTEGGTPEEPTFNLAFSGLKGEKGRRGMSVYRYTQEIERGNFIQINWDYLEPRGIDEVFQGDQVLAQGGDMFVVTDSRKKPSPVPVYVSYIYTIDGEDGAQGPAGADGVTPDIKVTATVDDTTGTPAVQVTKGGTTEEPTFNLAFSGLKGESSAGGGKVYRHFISYALYATSYSAVFSFEIFSADADPYNGNWPEALMDKCFKADGYYLWGRGGSADKTFADAVPIIGVRTGTEAMDLRVYFPSVVDKEISVDNVLLSTPNRNFFTETVQEMP